MLLRARQSGACQPAVFVLVNVAAGQEAAALAALRRVPGAADVTAVMGECDVICKILADDYDSLGDVVTGTIRRIPGIVAIRTLTTKPTPSARLRRLPQQTTT